MPSVSELLPPEVRSVNSEISRNKFEEDGKVISIGIGASITLYSSTVFKGITTYTVGRPKRV